MKIVDLTQFSNVVYLPEYDVALIKLNNKYLQIPKILKLKNVPENINFNKLVINKYIIMLIEKENIQEINNIKVSIAQTFARKININVKLISNIYKIISIIENDQYYPILKFNIYEQIDKDLIKEIIDKYSSINDPELKQIFLNRLNKNFYDINNIKLILNKPLKKKAIIKSEIETIHEETNIAGNIEDLYVEI